MIFKIFDEWNLYAGSLGSTCKNEVTASCLAGSTMPIASARSRQLLTSDFMLPKSRNAAAPFLALRALCAFLADETAFVKSAFTPSYVALSLTYVAVVFASNFVVSSTFCCSLPSVVIFSILVAVFFPISATVTSILSWPSTMDLDFVFVPSLQKHANFS